jgi:hypothetical protein
MPDKDTLSRAQEDRRKGHSASTQAGEVVREETSTSVQESTARARRSRLLPSGCPRPDLRG